MKKSLHGAAVLFLISSVAPAFAQTAYGSCPLAAETYQERYERNLRSSDLVCFQHALERELLNSSGASCPRNSQYYQTQYENSLRASDLVCFQAALERELSE